MRAWGEARESVCAVNLPARSRETHTLGSRTHMHTRARSFGQQHLCAMAQHTCTHPRVVLTDAIETHACVVQVETREEALGLTMVNSCILLQQLVATGACSRLHYYKNAKKRMHSAHQDFVCVVFSGSLKHLMPAGRHACARACVCSLRERASLHVGLIDGDRERCVLATAVRAFHLSVCVRPRTATRHTPHRRARTHLAMPSAIAAVCRFRTA